VGDLGREADRNLPDTAGRNAGVTAARIPGFGLANFIRIFAVKLANWRGAGHRTFVQGRWNVRTQRNTPKITSFSNGQLHECAGPGQTSDVLRDSALGGEARRRVRRRGDRICTASAPAESAGGSAPTPLADAMPAPSEVAETRPTQWRLEKEGLRGVEPESGEVVGNSRVERGRGRACVIPFDLSWRGWAEAVPPCRQTSRAPA
jgi:hypothetical protein